MPEPVERKSGRFPKGYRGPGKPVGAVTRIHRDLKQAILDAAAAHGSDRHGAGGLAGYCFYLASQHPRAFSGLLGRLLPMQISGSVSATIAAVNVVSIPSDRYMTREEMNSQPPEVEHEPQRDIDQDEIDELVTLELPSQSVDAGEDIYRTLRKLS